RFYVLDFGKRFCPLQYSYGQLLSSPSDHPANRHPGRLHAIGYAGSCSNTDQSLVCSHELLRFLFLLYGNQSHLKSSMRRDYSLVRFPASTNSLKEVASRLAPPTNAPSISDVSSSSSILAGFTLPPY